MGQEWIADQFGPTANDGRGAAFHFTLPAAADAVQVPAQERDSGRHPRRNQIHNHSKGTA